VTAAGGLGQTLDGGAYSSQPDPLTGFKKVASHRGMGGRKRKGKKNSRKWQKGSGG